MKFEEIIDKDMAIQIKYSEIDRRFYVVLIKGEKEITELGSQLIKPTQNDAKKMYFEYLWRKKCINL